jgi:uroporphyrinogen-III synthase
MTGDPAAAFPEQSSDEPLSGWRVLIPRPVDRSADLFGALQAVGARAVSVELISFAPPADPGELDLRLVDLAAGGYSWVGFTSANAVDAVRRRSAALGLNPAIPADTRVAAVGPATARALRGAGLPVDLVPPTGGSADALATIWPTAQAGQAVLLPRSDIAAPELPDALTAKGYRVDAVTAYRTEVAPAPAWLAAELAGGLIDAVLFTSPSTVRALDGVEIDPATVLGAIGRPTATAMRQSGRTVDFTAGQPTATALVDGLLDAVGLRSRPAAEK